MAADVTEQLLEELDFAPGPSAARARRASPAKKLTPALQQELDRLRNEADLTMGYISKPLIYSRIFDNPKRHSAIMRLIKGGHVNVIISDGPPPDGTRAKRESPYGQRYYELEIL